MTKEEFEALETGDLIHSYSFPELIYEVVSERSTAGLYKNAYSSVSFILRRNGVEVTGLTAWNPSYWEVTRRKKSLCTYSILGEEI
jgi:hypothetical protein